MFGIKKKKSLEKTDFYEVKVNGITFIADEKTDKVDTEIKKIASVYSLRKNAIAEFMIKNGITDIFGDMTKDVLVKKLGSPTIKPDICQIIYADHELDHTHIISLEYSGNLEKFLYFSIDG